MLTLLFIVLIAFGLMLGFPLPSWRLAERGYWGEPFDSHEVFDFLLRRME